MMETIADVNGLRGTESPSARHLRGDGVQGSAGRIVGAPRAGLRLETAVHPAGSPPGMKSLAGC